MYQTPAYPLSTPRLGIADSGSGREYSDPYATPSHPQDIRPLITRHRLRRQRRRKAATLLTGASIALGVAALRPPNASAHSAKSLAPITHTERHPVHDPVLTHQPRHVQAAAPSPKQPPDAPYQSP